MLHRVIACIFAALTLNAQAQDSEKLRAEAGNLTEEQVVEHEPRVAARTAAHASSASSEFDAVYYHLNLDVRFDPNFLFGSTRIYGRSTTTSLETLILDFGSSMQVDSVIAGTGEQLDFLHVDNALSIELQNTVQAGELIDLDVYYQGVPRVADFGIFRFGQLPNGDRFVWSLSEPYGAREWWPCKDHPSDKADSVRVTTTVPAPLRVASPGLELPPIENDDGTVTYDWISRYPIATYLVSIAGGIYDVYRQQYVRPDSLSIEMGALDLPLVHFAYAGSNVFEGDGASTGWRRVVDVLPVLEHWFGAYPFPNEKYGHAHVTFGGGMEHQTISSMGGNGLGLIVHELAHQWYGDLITMETWPHLWLNEGFANYSELLWWEQARAQFPATYDLVFDTYYTRALDAVGTLVVQDTLSIGSLFDSRLVYAKGGMVLHMLRGIVGDASFREILHTYTSSEPLRYGTATTADFREIAEEVSNLDLGPFFRQWVIEGWGAPMYSWQWTWTEASDGYEAEVEIVQVQAPPESNVDVFVMPITIAVQTSSGDLRFRVLNDQRRQRYVLRVDDQPTSVAVDPDRQILRRLSDEAVGIDPEAELPAPSMIVGIYPNPTTHMLRVELADAPTAPLRVELYDLLGRRLRKIESTERSLDLSLSDLASGSYIVRIENGGDIETRAVSLIR